MKKLLTLLILLPFLSTAQIITTFAGNGINSYTGDGGQATAAAISAPSGIVLDASGNVYITGYGNNTVRKISTSGIITTIAGNGSVGFSGDGGMATNAQLNSPAKLAIDRYGNLFVADKENHRVRKITPGGIITTVAGNGIAGYSVDGIAATSSKLNEPTGVAVDTFGNIYIADYTNNRVRKVSTTGIISTYAGTGVPGSLGDGGPATSAQLNGCHGVALDASGNLYLADQMNNKIRKINGSGTITTIAGTGISGFFGDGGPATAAKFNITGGVFVDTLNNIYVADEYNYRIRKISPAGIVNTICGNGTPGYTGDGIAATAAELNLANEVALDMYGNVLVVDNFNYRVRLISVCPNYITHQPVHDTVTLGSDGKFVVTTTMPSPVYQWQENPGTGFVNLVDVPPYSGVHTDTLTISNVIMLLNNTHYRCVIHNTSPCTDTSNAAILVVQSPTASNQLSTNSISIYPNPTSGSISVTTTPLNSNWMVTVSDLAGSIISSNVYSNPKFDIALNVANGLYFVRFTNQLTQESVVRKIVVQK